jgi:hypothetical protein
LFLAETFFIYPNVNVPEIQDCKDSGIIENEPYSDNVNKLLTNTPKAFTVNHGQLGNDEVRFYEQGGGVWFTDDGVWFELREEIGEERELNDIFELKTEPKSPEPISYKRVILKQEFVFANRVMPIGINRLSWNSNFFYGNDSSKWYSDVPNFGEIYYENIYDDIDLRYYTNRKGLKYDFIVHPGGDPNDIKLKINGANRLLINNDMNLKIETELGEIIDSNLYIYQNHGSELHNINGRFEVLNSSIYCFRLLDDYDKSLDLIIDPLIFSTYIGGANYERAMDLKIDKYGNSYITGGTNSSDFPTTVGAYDTTFNGTPSWWFRNIFVIKLDSTGSKLLYSTYIGGKSGNHETVRALELDNGGNACISGHTRSSDFPTTPGAYDRTFNSAFVEEDVFVLKLNKNGSKLIFSTFLGGQYQDFCWGMELDNNGSILVTGTTLSFDFPTTKGVYNTTFNGLSDCFIAKINYNGSKLNFSTFIGTSGWDDFTDITIDSLNNIYTIGTTNSTSFPTTPGAYDTSFNGNTWDLIVVKLNHNCSTILFSTYVGGNSDEYSWCIKLDSLNNIYAGGNTKSSNFPTTPNAIDTSFNGTWDVFLFKMNPNGSKLLFSTYIGGSSAEGGGRLEIKPDGNVTLIGTTSSFDFPTTSNAFDTTYNGNSDIFIIEIDHINSTIIYSTFIGGNGYDVGASIKLDLNENIYFSGRTNSSNFPIIMGAYDKTYNGGNDIYVAKYRLFDNNFSNVLDLKISKPQIVRTDSVYLFSNASDIEDLEKYLTPFFEYRDPSNLIWNNTFFSDPYYNNSRWEAKFTSTKNVKLGYYDFRVRFNDTGFFFSNWLYLNDSLLVLNNKPVVENLVISNNKTVLISKLLIWINSSDIENTESNLTIYLEYRDPSEQSWNISYISNSKYSNKKWEFEFEIPFNAPFGYYDFRLKAEDLDNDSSPWEYYNDSLLIFNKQPEVLDVKFSDYNIYRTNSLKIFINGSDYETFEHDLELIIKYKQINDTNWLNLPGNYFYKFDYWNANFETTIDTILGQYDFKFLFIDSENKESFWWFENNSIEVLNNKPIVTNLEVVGTEVYRTQSIEFKAFGNDIETRKSLLSCDLQYRTSLNLWDSFENIIFKDNYWQVNFTPGIKAELGYYDLRVKFIDTDEGTSDWTIIEKAFEVENNLPIISPLCDNFMINVTSKDIYLTSFGVDIEQSSNELNWGLDQNSVNKDLFSGEIIDNIQNILKIIPRYNVNGSDDITLILTDKDGGLVSKTDVTIFVNNLLEYIYSVNLTVLPNIIEIYQGESINVTLEVINIGNILDYYNITLQSNEYDSSDVKFETEFISLNSNENKYIIVTITASKNIEIGIYGLIFTVHSLHSTDEDVLTIEVREKFKDKIKNETEFIIETENRTEDEIENKTEDKTNDNRETKSFSIIHWIVIILIIVIIIIIVVIKKKKKEPEEINETQLEPTIQPKQVELTPEPSTQATIQQPETQPQQIVPIIQEPVQQPVTEPGEIAPQEQIQNTQEIQTQENMQTQQHQGIG